jgi:hypothetical protein
MEQLSSLGRQENTRSESPDTAANTEKFIRLGKKSILKQLLLVLGMSTGVLGCAGVASPTLSAPSAPTGTPTAPAVSQKHTAKSVSRTHAVTERVSEDPIDMNWLNNPIDLSLSAADKFININHREESWRPFMFSQREPARKYAMYDRETDINGDIELKYYHWQENYEWPHSRKNPTSPDLIRNGKLALSDWAFDHLAQRVSRFNQTSELQALGPGLLWKDDLDLDEDIDLQLSFDLTHDPRRHPLALARMTDNVSQILAFAAEKSTPENRYLRALTRPMLLFLFHVLGRMNAHYSHETAHAMDDKDIEMIFNGQRELSGIPGPAIFPQVKFLDENGVFHEHEDEAVRDRLIRSVVSGPNQHTLHNRLMYLRNLQNPQAMSTYDAWTYLIQNNLMPGSAPLGYMLSDQQKKDKETDNGDINVYIRYLKEKGIEVDLQKMIRNKAATLLGTADTYRAVIAVLNEVIVLINNVTGLNLYQIPDLPRGVTVMGADAHWPLVEHYMTENGEIVHVTLPINATRTFPVMLEFSTDLDTTQRSANVNTLRGGMTIGYRHKWFTIEAGGAIATERESTSSLKAISGIGRLTIPLSETGVRVMVEVVHQENLGGGDPINKLQGYEDGTNLTAVLSFNW